LVNDKYGNSDCHAYHDYREMLQREDMDAVSVVTPYHWHSLMGLAAARAGKDIFMEKPIALSLQEGKMLRETVNRYARVFQLGTQQRSNRRFRFACELVLNGRIGEIHTIKVGSSHGLTTPNYPAMPVPNWLDYDRWVGPASWSPYTENKMQRGFHENISDYSLGMIHCWGIHHLDIAQWGSGNEHTGPAEIEGTGTFPTDGLCDCLLDWDVNMRFANGVTLSFTDSQKNEHGIRFEGDEGWLFVNRRTLMAEPRTLLKEQIGADEHRLPVSNNHFQNFLDAVRTRQKPVSPIDVAVRSDTLCHLSYIAVVLGRQLRWDPVQERIVGNVRANQLLATRSMRSPWHL
jgi:predicted dehydrogenase